jgi:hypothetical protein
MTATTVQTGPGGPPSPAAASEPLPGGAAGNGPRVQPPRLLRGLIVEDQADARDSMALFLSLQGFDMAVARDGAEAYTATRNRPPAVLLMDIGLPGLIGWEVARQLWGPTSSGWQATRRRSRCCSWETRREATLGDRPVPHAARKT